MSSYWNNGNVVEIPLENGKYAYGVVVNFPLIAFSNLYFDKPQVNFSGVFDDFAFKLWVMKNAIGKRHWHVVGNIEISIESPVFYKVDMISKCFSHYHESLETESSLEQCIGLECAAVWEAEHIEERLLAKSVGKESIWEESLRAENRV